MKVQIIAPTQKTPEWVKISINEYQKRLKNELKLEIIDIPLINRLKKPLKEIITQEGKKIIKHIPQASFVIALTETGNLLSSQAFAQHLGQWYQQHPSLSFIIGSPEGLADICRDKANFTLSLSPLTFPHSMVKVILIEQLYRAITILKGHPYHK
ncbi:MAG: 23S rRNA (pseudouridine(1915)-N(3))-methyltransferase RlmH [Pseudomonadota bacterium]